MTNQRSELVNNYIEIIRQNLKCDCINNQKYSTRHDHKYSIHNLWVEVLVVKLQGRLLRKVQGGRAISVGWITHSFAYCINGLRFHRFFPFLDFLVEPPCYVQNCHKAKNSCKSDNDSRFPKNAICNTD